MKRHAQTKLKRPTPVRLQLVVRRLLANCKRIQKLEHEAKQQVVDAQMAYNDLCNESAEAWDKYYDAKNGEPPNADLRQDADSERGT